MLTAVLYAEINLLCIAILAIIFYKSRHDFMPNTAHNLFCGLLIVNIVLDGLDIVWRLTEQQLLPCSISTNLLLNTMYYILSVSAAFLWFMFSETVQQSTLISSQQRRVLCALPLLLAAALTIISSHTGWMFVIDAQNSYHRGPLYFVQIIIIYAYIITTAVRACYMAMYAPSYSKQREYFALASFSIPAVTLGLLQISTLALPLGSAGNMLGILSVFINALEQKVSRDKLTQLNNRFQLDHFLTNKLAHWHHSSTRQLWLILIDINDFKHINDRFGHIEGDEALRRTAEAIRQELQQGFAARYGGDEFIIVCEAASPADIQLLCTHIQTRLDSLNVNAPYSLTFSSGAACYGTQIHSIMEFIAVADAAMYENKQKYKLNRL